MTVTRAAFAGLLALTLAGAAAGAQAQVWRSDSGRGTYANPPLNADYPDPDIIRVGSDFYFASTTFLNTPGLVLLHSKDLVNWDIVSHVMPRLTGNPKYDLVDGGDYRHGVYAPSLRRHNGRFYIAVTPVGANTRALLGQGHQGSLGHARARPRSL